MDKPIKLDYLNYLDFSKFTEFDFSIFFKKYKLEESIILGSFVSGYNSLVLCIKLNPIWNPVLGLNNTQYVKDHPFLFLLMPCIHKLNNEYNTETGLEFEIAKYDTKPLKNKHFDTFFKNHYGDKIQIMHSESFSAYCITHDNNLIEL
ncbi:MAG: hypothetical protein JXL97_14455 [Bacteroidales bacterium]|nr:hypothetical protein [Bacteroidales bacterium]